jgi:hypothetical protein
LGYRELGSSAAFGSRASNSFPVVFRPALHYNFAMKFLPAALFFIGLIIVGGYVYESHHKSHPAYPPKSSAAAPPRPTAELEQRQQAIQSKLKAAKSHAQLVHGGAPSPGVQDEINQLQKELDQANAELLQSHQKVQPSQPASSQQSKLLASVIFGIAGMYLILSKSVPDSQKTFGYGLLTMILGFWLHL